VRESREHFSPRLEVALLVCITITAVALAAIAAVCKPRVAAGASASVVASSSGTTDCTSLTTCYSARQLEAAYGILPLLEHGTNGRGETVVLPELAEPQFPLPTSNIRRDLAEFDKLFHLPAARLGAVSTLAPSASPWLANGEEVLDTEMVHTVAPGAAIVEVLVKSTSLNTATRGVAAAVFALRLGTSLGSVISISAAGQTGGEHCDSRSEVAALHAALRTAAAHRVTVVAASGDIGAVGEPCQLFKGLTGGAFTPVKEVNLPASDPLVLAAGGTTLTARRKTGAHGTGDRHRRRRQQVHHSRQRRHQCQRPDVGRAGRPS
jgi:subtilase family serine protease